VGYPPPGLPRWFNGVCTSCGSTGVGEGGEDFKLVEIVNDRYGIIFGGIIFGVD
jgi:hypothetical protein